MIRVIWVKQLLPMGEQLKNQRVNRQKQWFLHEPSVVDASGKPATSPKGWWRFFLWDSADFLPNSINKTCPKMMCFPVFNRVHIQSYENWKGVSSQYFSRCLERFPNLQKNRRKPIYKKHVYVVKIYYNLLVLISTQFWVLSTRQCFKDSLLLPRWGSDFTLTFIEFKECFFNHQLRRVSRLLVAWRICDVSYHRWSKSMTGWWQLKYFLLSPLFGEDSHCD